MKASVRRRVLHARDSLESDLRRAKDTKIQEKFLSGDDFLGARNIMLFASFRSEPDTHGLIRKSLTLQKRVILPRVKKEGYALLLYEIKDHGELVPGYMDIPEPSVPEERRFDGELLDLIVMPGVAFDREGGRLGYGGGYYDRFIASLDRRPPLVALAYEEQIIDRVPLGDHDIRVDTIITDERVIQVIQSKPEGSTWSHTK